MSSWCDAPLAILTSGQAARFTYKAQFAFVRGRSGRSSLQQLLVDRSHHPPCVPIAVDAFVVLSEGRASVWAHEGAFSGTSADGGGSDDADDDASAFADDVRRPKSWPKKLRRGCSGDGGGAGRS